MRKEISRIYDGKMFFFDRLILNIPLFIILGLGAGAVFALSKADFPLDVFWLLVIFWITFSGIATLVDYKRRKYLMIRILSLSMSRHKLTHPALLDRTLCNRTILWALTYRFSREAKAVKKQFNQDHSAIPKAI